MATVADVLVSRLREAGTACLFGVPGGGSNLDLVEAAGRGGLRFVLTSTETGAALAAIGHAEVAGHVGACLTTLGPGAASVVNGVACALLDRAPLVVLTDSLAADARACEHQRLDQRALFAPITKLSRTLEAADADEIVQLALHTAESGCPGPVHLDCPGDVASTELPAAPLPAPARAPHRGSARDEAGDRDTLDALLRSARKPLLLVGLGARRPSDAAAIRGLCEQHRVPALVTYKAKGVVPDSHAWFAGVFTNAAIERPLVDESDLLIGVGLDPVELLPRRWTAAAPVVSVGPWKIEATHVPVAASVVTDVPAAAAFIAARLSPSSWDGHRVAADLARQRSAMCIPVEGLSAQAVVETAAERLAPAWRVTVDAGAHMFPATMLWPVAEPSGMLISNGLSTMGWAVPAAIGAALADRERPVVALTGDGGLLMSASELLTAVRERLKIMVIVFNDASLSLIEIKQRQRRQPAAGVALGAVDWVRVAAGYGVPGWRATDEAGLARAVEGAMGADGPSLVEACIDRSNYGAILKAIRG